MAARCSSFVISCRRYFKSAADDRDALEVSAQNSSRRVTMSLLVPNAYISLAGIAMRKKRKQILKHS